jgi:hypothetical protein
VNEALSFAKDFTTLHDMRQEQCFDTLRLHGFTPELFVLDPDVEARISRSSQHAVTIHSFGHEAYGEGARLRQHRHAPRL